MRMTSDSRDDGYPLLKQIILQAEIVEKKYDVKSGEQFSVFANEISHNGIGHQIYKPPKGYFMQYQGNPQKSQNYICISPFTDKKFNWVIDSNHYMINLSIVNATIGSYCFAIQDKASITNAKLKHNMPDYDINLSLYASSKVKELDMCSFQAFRERRKKAKEEQKKIEEAERIKEEERLKAEE